MRTAHFLRPDLATALSWDGTTLRGNSTSKAVAVAVPARYVSFRLEILPPAMEPALKAAARLRAERAFSPLGPVAIDALLPPARDGRCQALLMALPKTTLEAIRKAAATQGRTVHSIHVAELAVPIPDGGQVTIHGDACLIALDRGQVTGIAALGPTQAPGFAASLVRERMRLGMSERSSGGPAPGMAIDFLRPSLAAPQALLTRPAFRLGILAAGIVLVIAAGITLAVHDAITARDEALAEAARLRPLASALATRRSDMKEAGAWLDARVSLAPGMHALATALPPGDAKEQIRLVRVRQSLGEDTIVEAAANDRAGMLAYVERLRADPRVAFAEVRTSRSPSKETKNVVFELLLRLQDTAPTPAGIPSSTRTRTPKPETPETPNTATSTGDHHAKA
jgi:hypothetical protein